MISQRIGIGTTNPNLSSMVDIQSTNKGLLLPRMNSLSINSINNPATGLMVYDSTQHQLMVNMGSYNDPDWRTIIDKSAWSLNGNEGINSAIHYIGTTDNQPLRFRTNNVKIGELHPVYGSIFWGMEAGVSVTTGKNNIAIGKAALKNNDFVNQLLAIGDSSLFSNIFCSGFGGKYNAAIGFSSLRSNVCGNLNTAVGFKNSNNNISGFENTSLGAMALYQNIDQSNITAMGALALKNNYGKNNTVAGNAALFNNTLGISNAGIGVAVMYQNQVENSNTAAGAQALHHTSLSYNTCAGYQALFSGVGDYNTAIGHKAGNSFTGISQNTLIGAGVDVSSNNQVNSIAIGEGTVSPGSNAARIGNVAVSSIGGYAAWTNFSDGRYKFNVEEKVPGLDFINQLQPVTYQLEARRLSTDTGEEHGTQNIHFDKAVEEKEEIIYSGFIAQQVEEAAIDNGFDFIGIDKLPDENGMYGLRYATFVVPLVKAVQELNEENQWLRAQIEEQERIVNEFSVRLAQLKSK